MLGFNAFKGVDASVLTSVKNKSGFETSLGVHNSLLQMANVSGFTTPGAIGAGVGAAYGAFNGLTSYDGSMFGGAFHGAMVGGIGGLGAKFAANTYAKGALNSGYAKGNVGSYTNSWSLGAFKNSEGKDLGAFQSSAFKGGW